jgi:hypothetical protein
MKKARLQIKRPTVDIIIHKERTICMMDFVEKMDPVGYFLIRINKDMIEVGLCDYKDVNKIKQLWTGSKPQNIYHQVIKDLPKIQRDHCAYLGKELARAYICMRLCHKYVQDGRVDGSFPEVEMIRNANV